MTRRLLVLVILISSVPIYGAAADAPPIVEERGVAWLEALREQHAVPALGSAWIDARGVRRVSVTGTAVRGQRGALDADARWHLGSCSKAMTATLAARLVEAGVMRWDMTIEEVFPKQAGAFREPYRSVTLEELATNRGGIPGDVTRTPAWVNAWKARGTAAAQRRRCVTRGATRGPRPPTRRCRRSSPGGRPAKFPEGLDRWGRARAGARPRWSARRRAPAARARRRLRRSGTRCWKTWCRRCGPATEPAPRRSRNRRG